MSLAVDTEMGPISDEELTAQSLAADPDQPIDPGAVPLAEFLAGDSRESDLPSWYMPAAQSHGGRRHLAVIGLIILALLVVMVFGYCITYGQLVVA